MEKIINFLIRFSLLGFGVFFCEQTLSEVKIFEAKLNNKGLEQIRERITPELYLYDANSELKLRSLGYE